MYYNTHTHIYIYYNMQFFCFFSNAGTAGFNLDNIFYFKHSSFVLLCMCTLIEIIKFN